MADDNPITDAAKASLVAVANEVYSDGLKPAVSRIGNTLGALAGAVDVLFGPLRTLVFHADLKEKMMREHVAEALTKRNVPPERLIPPRLSVAAPALQAMMYADDSPELSDMFAALLAEAMDNETAHLAHPAFVDVLRQMTPDEARITHLFATGHEFPLWEVEAYVYKIGTTGITNGMSHAEPDTVLSSLSLLGSDADCQFLDLVPSYINNLVRLGLCYITSRQMPHTFRNEVSLLSPNYDACHPRLGELISKTPEIHTAATRVAEADDAGATNHVIIWTRFLRVTDFGKQFCSACILPA